MQIYLLRHGIAEAGRPGMADRDRALVSEGRKKLRSILAAASSAGVAPATILSSPYLRARQTAEIARDIVGGELLESPALVPSSRPEAVWDEIRVHKDAAQLLLVGHEPLFSQLMAFLLGVPELIVDFKKGALARVDFEGPITTRQPRCALRWFLTAKLVDGDASK
ncbi:MAG: histidine phosphatase family protein [Bryobacteraceae bacterium]